MQRQIHAKGPVTSNTPGSRMLCCQAPGVPGLLVTDLDLDAATGLLAQGSRTSSV